MSATSRYYFESYVLQDGNWNPVTSGWLDANGAPQDAYGRGSLLSATYNSPVTTYVWDDDASPPAWLAPQTETPDTISVTNKPAAAPGSSMFWPAVLGAAAVAVVAAGAALVIANRN